MQNSGTMATSAPRLSWREKVAGFCAQPDTQSRLLGGSVTMLIGSGLVSILNFAYNVAVARLLGPAEFGHAAVAITLLMLVSALTLSFQLVCAKLVARNQAVEARAAVYQTLLRRAWKVGLALGTALMLASGPVARYLNLPSPWMIPVLALGFAFYVPVGARRGGMQGMCSFRRLASSYVIEALLKLIGAVLLVEFGLGALGAITAISLSIICAYFLPVPAALNARTETRVPASIGEAVQAVVFFVGQVIISNCDIILVKHFFQPETAGLYAAVALVGRVVYFASWMVVSAMFPISAGAHAAEESKSILAVPVTFVVGISGGFVVLMALAPDFVLRLVFGPHFTQVQSVDGLLALYAAMAGVYSLSVVLIAYEMSRKVANTGWLQLVVAFGIVAGIFFFHSTLHQVVMVQLVAMAALLALVAVIPFLRRGHGHAVLQEAA
jgi:O-antigen/teichoic acid export membrane protein